MSLEQQIRKSFTTGGATEWARNRLRRNRQGEGCGFYSVCSAHHWVLEAAVEHATAQNTFLSIESTSNQVNQFGGYTGLNPPQFASEVFAIAERCGLQRERLLLGGDHLGPYPWRHLPSTQAMSNALELVRECVFAGYQKIHLDASMRCADDPVTISEDEVARRAALLCQAAERTCRETGRHPDSLMYVIGSEVPIPGGEQADDKSIHVTDPKAVRYTLQCTEQAFAKLDLQEAWSRVIALVVQPGVEFGDTCVVEYQRENARGLTATLPSSPGLVYEAHSTDYQTPSALKQLVEDHFSILKVGPWLTFAMREAIFALSAIEREWLTGAKDLSLSDVPDALDRTMLAKPEYWKGYYQGTASELRFARKYSYSDRCRYYWSEPTVDREVRRLIQNLSVRPIPLALLSQFMPVQHEKVRDGLLRPVPECLVKDKVRHICAFYNHATSS